MIPECQHRFPDIDQFDSNNEWCVALDAYELAHNVHHEWQTNEFCHRMDISKAQFDKLMELEYPTDRLSVMNFMLGIQTILQVGTLRPINTLPQSYKNDEEQFLALSPRGLHVTWWECVDGGGFEDGPPIYWWSSDTCEYMDGPDDAPTHWMPLPTFPPQEERDRISRELYEESTKVVQSILRGST